MFSIVLKDYLDRLHDISLLGDSVDLLAYVKATVAYITQSSGLAFWYIVSFHWVRDFMDLPVIFKHNYTVILEGQSVLKRSYELTCDFNRGTYSLLDTAPMNTRSVFSGFLNSFFLCLPLSVPHILSARALIVNGIPAGVSSALGLICGQILFFSFILFGLEIFVQPFFQFEPVIILAGFLITLSVVSGLGSKCDYSLWTVRHKKSLRKVFWINFALAWCEQICVSNYFGNLTFTNSASMVELTSGSFLSYGFMTLTYVLGLALGSFIWTGLFGALLLQGRSLISRFLVNTSVFDINRNFHVSSIVGLFALAMASFPYFGFDYFLPNTLGYLPEDPALAVTVTPKQRELQIISRQKVYQATEDEDEISDVIGDLSPFQKPDYAPEPTFESVAIPSENDWFNRFSTRERVVEKTGLGGRERALTHLPYRDDPNYYIVQEKKYSTPQVDADDFFYAASSEEVRIFEILVENAFRTDVYVEFRDLASDSYLPDTQVLRQFRERYYTNPLYKGLVNVNTATFLSGQPKTSSFSVKDEHTLYLRRLATQRYLDSLCRYRKIIANRSVNFPEKVYNQQFKGALDFVRKFNAVRLTEYGEIPNQKIRSPEDLNQKVLKLDQSLYKQSPNVQKALLHEELKSPRGDRNPKRVARRYLKANDTRPLYIGWDQTLRKFMLKSAKIGILSETSQAIPHTLSSQKTTETPETNQKLSETVNEVKTTSDLESSVKTEAKSNRKTVRIPKSLPESYHFQVWSPGIEKEGKNSLFKLPDLALTRDEALKIQQAFGLINSIHSETDNQAFATQSRAERFKASMDRYALKQMFKRIPMYNWYWAHFTAFESDDVTDASVFYIGTAAPPRYDGLAWPGQNDHISWEDPEED